MSEKTTSPRISTVADFMDTVVKLHSTALDSIDARIAQCLFVLNNQLDVKDNEQSLSRFGFPNSGAFKITLRWLYAEPTAYLIDLLSRIQSSGITPKEAGVETIHTKTFNRKGELIQSTRYAIRGLSKLHCHYNASYEMGGYSRRVDAAADTLYKELNLNAGDNRCDFKLWQMRQSAEMRDILVSIRNSRVKSNFVSATFLCDVIEPQS